MSEILLKSAGMNKSSNTLYLGYGLLIGAALAALALAAISIFQSNHIARALIGTEPAETLIPPPLFTSPRELSPDSTLIPPIATAPPTPTFTPTPTYIVLNPTSTETPIPTDTPIPSPTLPIGEQKLLSGELALVGPLTKEQQLRLYDTSIRYIALTTEESRVVGERLAGDGYGSPTLICGPLSIHILQTSGLLSIEGLMPLDFWLLNPFLAKDRLLVNRTFPPAQYEHHEIIASIRDITFSTFPLYPGDFLYIKHGSGGTFDHMLVVNRVDNMGRAYAVTNFDTGQGFIINEILLYDPTDPATGIFKVWTQRRNSPNGATGFGGFELWRRRAP
jgi:hypothetical protein